MDGRSCTQRAAKEQHPDFGAGRVMTWLRRTLFLPITCRQAHATLREENLLQKPLRRRKSPPPKPQFFERARPNPLWQSDITAFTIVGGLRVYLIGFMDDHSRHRVGRGLYAGQSGKLERGNRDTRQWLLPFVDAPLSLEEFAAMRLSAMAVLQERGLLRYFKGRRGPEV